MATKGASNHYGNSRGSSKGHATKHTSFAWAKAFNKSTLSNHFNRHGSQMNADSIESYIAHSLRFANTIDRKNNISFVDKNYSTYKYNIKTNELTIITKNGIVITYYKPKNGLNYYLDQFNKKNINLKKGKKKQNDN